MQTEMPEQPAQHLCPKALGDGTHFSATRCGCDVKPWKMEFAREKEESAGVELDLHGGPVTVTQAPTPQKQREL